MFSISGSKYWNAFCATIALAGAIVALFGNLLPGVDLSASSGAYIARRALNHISNVYTPALNFKENSYEIQIFSWNPLVIIIQNFVSSDEITHLLTLRYTSSDTDSVMQD